MFTVDPSAILSTLVKAGGIFIPKSSQKDVQILRDCLHCERAEINVVEKTMILYNWSVGLEGQAPALQVGRAYVHWDSYLHPTISVEVDNVVLLVDFYNLMLTKSNWQAIHSRGFPPNIVVSPVDGDDKTISKAQRDNINDNHTTDHLVRFESIDLSGKARVLIKSQPLNKDLGILELDMDSFDDFTALMKEASATVQGKNRRGLTPPEVATLLQNYFTQKIRAYIYEQWGDIITDKKDFWGDAKSMVHKAAGSVLNYATDASRKTGDDWQEKLATRLGVSKQKLDLVRDSLLNVNATAVRSAYFDLTEAYHNAAARENAKT